MIFNILVFLFVLGLLVFFHELGHFLAAKACGVYCDRFSLGMPPRVWGIRIGETDYCLGALPIGGYVKMAGQEDAPKTDEEREEEYGHVPPERWFNNKPVWQRGIIVFAGPMMNLVLAVVLYGIVAGVGAMVPESEVDNRIGLVMDGYPAATAPMYALANGADTADVNGKPDTVGWQTGDRIVSINGEEVQNIQDVAIAAVLNKGEKTNVIISRQMPDGTTKRYLSPVEPLAEDGDSHPRYGVAPYQTALVRDTVLGSPAREAGIESGDVIVQANGENVDAQTFTTTVSKDAEDAPIQVMVDRDGKTMQFTLVPKQTGRIEDVAFSPPLDVLVDLPDKDNPTVVVSRGGYFSKPSPASEAFFKRTGFQPGDTIVDIDGLPATAARVRDLEQTRHGQDVTVTVRRGTGFFGMVGKETEAQVTVSMDDLVYAVTGINDQQEPTVAATTPHFQEATGLRKGDVITQIDGKPATVALLRDLEKTQIGKDISVEVSRPPVLFGLRGKAETFSTTLPVSAIGVIGVIWDTKYVFHREPPAQVIPEALHKTYLAFDRTIKTIDMLVTGHASPKDLGGPVMIYQVTTQAARLGYSWLLMITAFISVNLCVFNLLPLPVLDGGLLVVLAIEGIRRKPVDARILERVQQVGLAFIILLILFVTYNDVMRNLSGSAL